MRRLALAVSPALLAVTAFAVPVTAAVSCEGRAATIVGTNGDNTLVGTPEPDVIVGKGGNDTIKGRGGRDLICGSSGDDRIYGGSGNDRLFGGSGYDLLVGNAGNDRLFGFDGLDVLKGGGGDDRLKGGADVDWLYGQTGSDNIFGDAGDDHLFAGADGDPDGLTGGADSDECDSEPADDFEAECERANFGVAITGPSSAVAGADIDFKITVRNHGPDTASYELRPTYSWTDATCTFATWGYLQPPLAPDAEKEFSATMNCQITGASPTASVEADVDIHGRDPTSGNDHAASADAPIEDAP